MNGKKEISDYGHEIVNDNFYKSEYYGNKNYIYVNGNKSDEARGMHAFSNQMYLSIYNESSYPYNSKWYVTKDGFVLEKLINKNLKFNSLDDSDKEREAYNTAINEYRSMLEIDKIKFMYNNKEWFGNPRNLNTETIIKSKELYRKELDNFAKNNNLEKFDEIIKFELDKEVKNTTNLPNIDFGNSLFRIHNLNPQINTKPKLDI